MSWESGKLETEIVTKNSDSNRQRHRDIKSIENEKKELVCCNHKHIYVCMYVFLSSSTENTINIEWVYEDCWNVVDDF